MANTIEEDRSYKEDRSSQSNDDKEYYVVLKGRHPNDADIYGTWAKTAPKSMMDYRHPSNRRLTRKHKKYLAGVEYPIGRLINKWRRWEMLSCFIAGILVYSVWLK